MKIYTKTGDDGRTGLLAGGRVSKDCPRIEAYGTVDELNAQIGIVRSCHLDSNVDSLLATIQEELFLLGSALADPDPEGRFHHSMKPELAARLEQEIDHMEADLEPLTRFILPGGTAGSAHLQLARTICRRAERRVVHLADLPGEHVPLNVVIYLNRLSDWLFVLARLVNHRAGVSDIPWRGM